jgi:ribonuclease HI
MLIKNLYTDGACSGNPGPGGWGVIIQDPADQKDHELFGGEADTTNNRMEMMAAIKGIEAATDGSLHVYTDSSYLKDGITSWLSKWQRNGWKTASNQPVKNKDLWEHLDFLCQGRQIAWHWVRGHAGHPLNERADFLARHAVMQQMMRTMVTNARG